MNEFNPAVIRYGNNFQEEKCRFGEKCKYKHEINPEFKKKEIIGDDRKKNNIITNKNNNKIRFKKRRILIRAHLITILLVNIVMFT